MKRFRFPLERVRSLSLARLKIEEAALESALDEVRRAETAFAGLVTGTRALETRTIHQALIPSSELVVIDELREHVKREQSRLDSTKKQAQPRIDELRNRVVESKRKLELLDRLHDRQFKAWSLEADRELQTMADEAFVQRLLSARRLEKAEPRP